MFVIGLLCRCVYLLDCLFALLCFFRGLFVCVCWCVGVCGRLFVCFFVICLCLFGRLFCWLCLLLRCVCFACCVFVRVWSFICCVVSLTIRLLLSACLCLFVCVGLCLFV